jgi:hypothetical protein
VQRSRWRLLVAGPWVIAGALMATTLMVAWGVLGAGPLNQAVLVFFYYVGPWVIGAVAVLEAPRGAWLSIFGGGMALVLAPAGLLAVASVAALAVDVDVLAELVALTFIVGLAAWLSSIGAIAIGVIELRQPAGRRVASGTRHAHLGGRPGH